MTVNENYKKLKHDFGKEEAHFLSIGEMFDDIQNWMETYVAEYEDIAAILDYSLCSNRPDRIYQVNGDYPEVKAVLTTGGSEGIYVDLSLCASPWYQHIATYKTLDESLDAYMKMGMLSGILTIAAEYYFFCNDKNIADRN